MKIDRDKLKEALEVAKLTEWDDNHEEWGYFLVKHGCQPHHVIEEAAQILLGITDHNFIPTKSMISKIDNDLLEWEDMNEGTVFRAMAGELCK